jgi:transcriptional regulator with XRE-family HTH domain
MGMNQPTKPLNTAASLYEWLSRYPDFREQIKILRRARGMTQDDLAKLVDRTPRSIRMIENGEASPRLTTLQKIAAALNAEIVISLLPGTGASQIAANPPPGEIDQGENSVPTTSGSDILIGETD